uniref:Uncharacterized protein n=1 Tax=Knipowitschia caucasica TaxID=637954 RepID=A0AAV2K845_KNICA
MDEPLSPMETSELTALAPVQVQHRADRLSGVLAQCLQGTTLTTATEELTSSADEPGDSRKNLQGNQAHCQPGLTAHKSRG